MGLNFGGATPKMIDLASVTDISMNGPHILALTTNGELYAWVGWERLKEKHRSRSPIELKLSESDSLALKLLSQSEQNMTVTFSTHFGFAI